MSDDSIDQLQRDWQSLECDVSHVVRRLRRNRWTPQLVLGLEVLGYAVTFLVGIWFAWIATHQPQHRLLFALSAAILLIAAPVLAVATAMARRSSLAWADETPESILRIGIRRAEASMQAMRVARWHVATIAGFVVVLWLLQWLRWIEAKEFLILYSSVCLVVSLGSWIWMGWRTQTVCAQRDACKRLLSALQVENDTRKPSSEANA